MKWTVSPGAGRVSSSERVFVCTRVRYLSRDTGQVCPVDGICSRHAVLGRMNRDREM